MRLSRLILILGSAALLCGNYVPPSTTRELRAHSDAVIVGTVIETGISAPAGASDKFEKTNFVIGRIVSSPCAKVRVEKKLKGLPAPTITVCRHRISELNPKPVQLGRQYRMFLTNAGPAYVPTSWDAYKHIP